MRLIARFVIWPLIILILVIGFIVWNGGDKIRWFGKKSEETGKAIQKKSQELGKTSDRLRETIDEQKKIVEEKIEKAVDSAEEKGFLRREPAEGEKPNP